MTEKDDGWIGDLVGAICDPLIVYPGGWEDSLPDWLKKKVTTDRLLENMLALKEGREVTATDAEVACYLFTTSLSMPMHGDWVQIYLYVAGNEMKAKADGGMPEEIRVLSLTEDQQRKLKDLRVWLYSQRVKHRLERQHTARREERQAASTIEEPDIKPAKPSQPSFF